VNDQAQQTGAAPSTYLELDRNWADGDVVEIEFPMSLHIAPAPDDVTVQAAMYGPLVLAVRMGIEGLSASMISGGGPDGRDFSMPMPEVSTPDIWLERTEATRRYPLIFHSKGRGGLVHTLVPLYQIMDERYSVYVKSTVKA
jgi:uncharacterized protein